MEQSQSRRIVYYRSAIPWIFLLGFCLVFVLLAALNLLFHHPMRQKDVNISWIVLGLFGAGAATVAWHLFSDRHWPLLKFTPEGISSSYSRLSRRIVDWADVRALTLLVWESRENPNRSRHFLVVTVQSRRGLDNPGGLERFQTVVDSLPDKDRVAILVLLDVAYLLTPGDQIRSTTLDRIKTEFAPEIQRYGITVSESVRQR